MQKANTWGAKFENTEGGSGPLAKSTALKSTRKKKKTSADQPVEAMMWPCVEPFLE